MTRQNAHLLSRGHIARLFDGLTDRMENQMENHQMIYN